MRLKSHWQEAVFPSALLKEPELILAVAVSRVGVAGHNE